MYLINARGKRGSFGVTVDTATDALSKVHDLDGNLFILTVFDDRGRERSVQEIEVAAADEARAFAQRPFEVR